MSPIILGILLPKEAVGGEIELGVLGATVVITLSVVISVISLYLIIKYEKNKTPEATDYRRNLDGSIKSLKSSYENIESTILDIEINAEKKEEELQVLEKNINKLIEEENKRRAKIEELKNVPLPIADQFMELLQEDRKKSGKSPIRIIVFIAGCIISGLIGYGINSILDHYFITQP